MRCRVWPVELQELHGLGTWPWPEQRRQEGMMEMDLGGLGIRREGGLVVVFSELRDGFLLVFSFSSFKGRRDCRCGRFCAVAFLVVDGDWTCVACLGSRCRE